MVKGLGRTGSVVREPGSQPAAVVELLGHKVRAPAFTHTLVQHNINSRFPKFCFCFFCIRLEEM